MEVEKNLRCIKEFVVSLYDADGFETGDIKKIEKDTTWYLPEDINYRFLGGEVRLESDENGWIEIPWNEFKEHFSEE